MEASRLVLFTTDVGYLIPTLVAAGQVAAQTKKMGDVDVLVFLIDLDEVTTKRLRELYPELMFQALDASLFELSKGASYNKTHVPRSALARLVTGPLIAEHYQFITYLDGDIQVVGDIAPLVRAEIPEGFFLAAPDHAELCSQELGSYARHFRSYLSRLGVRADEYFNSGVLAASRKTWCILGQEALAFMRAHSAVCLYHDQSALNRVAKGRRLKLSPRYNLTSWYQELDLQAVTPVSIIHFSGGIKPWADWHPASGGAYRHLYHQLADSDPMLRDIWRVTAGRNQGLAAPEDPRESTYLEKWRRITRSRRARRMTLKSSYTIN